MSDDFELTSVEVQQGVVDSNRSKLRQKFDVESAQGVLPLTNKKLFEQSNPILRSSLFSAKKMDAKPQYMDWTEVFSMGSGSILYRGPMLTVDHEVVLVKLMVLARGRSLTQPIPVTQADICRLMNMDAISGANYRKVRRILDDLASAEFRISSRPALQRLLSLLQSPAIPHMADGKFFVDFIQNRFGAQLEMIAAGLHDNQPVDLSMKFITSQTHNRVTKKMLISIDPLTTLFFDGVNTTLIPFEIWDELDRFGKKLLPLIASHRDGVYSYKMERYHDFSGSRSDYSVVKRRFKSDLKKRFQDWEEKGYIVPGWNISQNPEGEEIVSGLRVGEKVRIKGKVGNGQPESLKAELLKGSEEAMEARVNEFADSKKIPRPRSRRKTATPSTL